MQLKDLLREPLVHFLVLGGLLYAGWYLVAPPEDDTIVVRDELVAALEAEHTRRTGEPPDAEALEALVQAHVDKEILFREGMALGLDRGDPIVRRRIIQKMEYLHEALVDVETPSDDDLERWLATHPERYALPARITFRQHFFDADRREEPAVDAALALAELQVGERDRIDADPFLHGQRFVDQDRTAIAKRFGEAFAEQALAAPAQTWTALDSVYGTHLVYVEDQQLARPATLADVRDEVARDWSQAERSRRASAALADLRERYDVVRAP